MLIFVVLIDYVCSAKLVIIFDITKQILSFLRAANCNLQLLTFVKLDFRSSKIVVTLITANMKEEEKVANCVNAKAIREQLLEALHLTAGQFATALGINYQRVYDLGSGRTQKFNPNMVRLITKVFPNVNPHFLYSGEGPVLLSPGAGGASSQGSVDLAELMSMSKRLLLLMERLDEKDRDLRDREAAIIKHEILLASREAAIVKREAELSIVSDFSVPS